MGGWIDKSVKAKTPSPVWKASTRQGCGLMYHLFPYGPMTHYTTTVARNVHVATVYREIVWLISER